MDTNPTNIESILSTIGYLQSNIGSLQSSIGHLQATMASVQESARCVPDDEEQPDPNDAIANLEIRFNSMYNSLMDAMYVVYDEVTAVADDLNSLVNIYNVSSLFKNLLDQGQFCGATDCPYFGLRVTLPMGLKARVVLSPVDLLPCACWT